MTLRQKKFMERLKENGYNVRKTALEVGYSKSYAHGPLQKDIRKPNNRIYKGLQKRWTEESVKREIDKALRDFKKADDSSNRSRMIELKTKILGMSRDVVQHEGDVPSNILINYGNAPQKVDKQDIATSKEDKQA